MNKPRDVFRSFVRAAADGAKKRVETLGGLDKIRASIDNLVKQRIAIEAPDLTATVAHLPGVESASVTASSGALHVDVAFADGSFVQARLLPARIRFAPRGAKEVAFRVEPPEAARQTHITDVISAIGGAIATTLWPVARFSNDRNFAGAIVDRDGPDGFTVDLRTAPAIRALESRGGAGLVTEVIELGDMTIANGALVLQLKLPQLAP